MIQVPRGYTRRGKPLIEWLKENQLTQVQFSVLTGIHKQAVFNLCHFKVSPSKRIIEKVLKATEGQVDANGLHGI